MTIQVLHMEKDNSVKNRFYIIDYWGNKLFYGTTKQCKLFVKFIEPEEFRTARKIFDKMQKEGVLE